VEAGKAAIATRLGLARRARVRQQSNPTQIGGTSGLSQIDLVPCLLPHLSYRDAFSFCSSFFHLFLFSPAANADIASCSMVLRQYARAGCTRHFAATLVFMALVSSVFIPEADGAPEPAHEVEDRLVVRDLSFDTTDEIGETSQSGRGRGKRPAILLSGGTFVFRTRRNAAGMPR